MKLVILDRDGVINVDSEQFVKSAAEWKAMPGSPEAIASSTTLGMPSSREGKTIKSAAR